MIRNDSLKVFFDKFVARERGKVIGWLNWQFSGFPITECEDIFQEASLALWNKMQEMDDWKNQKLEALLKTICYYISTHHQHKAALQCVELKDCYSPQETMVEMDCGLVSSGFARMMVEDTLYAEIEKLRPKDRFLITERLKGVAWKDIYRQAGFGSVHSAKNRYSKLVVRLRNAINGQASQDARPSFFAYTDLNREKRKFVAYLLGGLRIYYYEKHSCSQYSHER